MKITFIIGSLGFGGKERQLYYLIKHQPKSIEQQLIVLSEIIKYDDIYNHIDNIIIISNKNKYSQKWFKKIYKEIKDFSPDLIHSWDDVSPLFVKPLCLLKGIKLVSSVRTSTPYKSYSFEYFISKFREAFSDLIVSNSQKGLEARGLDNKSKAICIYNGLNLDQFDTKDRLLSEIVLDNSKFHVCMVGRFFPAKDYKTLIEVCKSINNQKSGKSVVFHSFGDGPEREKYQEIVKEESLGNFIFHGAVSGIETQLSNFDIGILLNPTSNTEGISNAIMEYMAAELPVIATGVGGNPELVRDNINGFLVDPFDSKEITKKLLFLISNKEEAAKMGRRGRRIIEDSFSLGEMISQYNQSYQKLLS